MGRTPTWNHAGSCLLSLRDSLIGARFRFTHLAVFIREAVLVGNYLWVVWLWQVWVGGDREVRKMLTLLRHCTPSGLMQLRRVSVVKAQVGRGLVVSRYFLSQVISIARLQASRSRRSMPPSFWGLWRHLRAMGGTSSHSI